MNPAVMKPAVKNTPTKNTAKNRYILSKEVKEALKHSKPVVALETAILTHGLPKPKNVNLVLEVEKIIRKEGAVPATIGIIDGTIKIGCNEDEIFRLGTEKKVYKASIRDLPILCAKRLSGGTTVASTAFIASKAGIKVFVTGGIGGVHRRPENSNEQNEQNYDVSADIPILGLESILVVSSGAKLILDIPATLEMLETYGVTILGYRTERFPGFFVRETEYHVDAKVNSPDEAAKVFIERENIGLPGAVLLVNPCPSKYAIDRKVAENAIKSALEEAKEKKISGKELTPFLLRYLTEATHGKTLNANLALVKGNARLGAKVASSLSNLSLSNRK